MHSNFLLPISNLFQNVFFFKYFFISDLCLILDVIGLSREINIFFCELFVLCPCLFRRFFYEIILYLVIADTNLQTLFNLLNLTFENILNC